MTGIRPEWLYGDSENDRRYRVERLSNGYVRVDDRASELVGMFNRDGSYRHGALHHLPASVIERVKQSSSQ
jgi:hypothetical protein